MKDKMFAAMVHLVNLYLNTNYIHHVGAQAFATMSHLKKLQLTRNYIKQIDISYLPPGAYVDLTYNLVKNTSGLLGFQTASPDKYRPRLDIQGEIIILLIIIIKIPVDINDKIKNSHSSHRSIHIS